MVNEDYDPTDNEEEILEVLTEGRNRGEAWGYTTPKHLKVETDLNDQQINYAMNQLQAAGWVTKVVKGLYKFVEDPREEGETDA